MAQLTISLLGGFQARLDGGPLLALPAKAQALLAYVSARPGQAHPRDKLAALLWGDTGQAQARSNLRHTLFTIRQAVRGLSPGVLVAEAQAVALETAAVDVDVLTFEKLVAEGTAEAIERAPALYQGELLEGLSIDEPPFEEWLLAERERLRELALEALARLLAQQSRDQATERAIQTAIRLLALDPLQEPAHRTLMRLYARQGRRSAALKQYQVCVGVLRRELGAEPEPETRRLYQDILQQRASKSAESEARLTRATPRPRPAEPVNEGPLIGRERELAQLRRALDEVRSGPGRVVRGEAGVGKGSLVKVAGADGRERGARILLGSGYESQQGLLLRELIQIAIGLTSERHLALLPARILTEARRFTHAEAGTLYLRDGDRLRVTTVQNDVLARRFGEREMLRFFPSDLPVRETSLVGYVALSPDTPCFSAAYQIPTDTPYRFKPTLD